MNYGWFDNIGPLSQADWASVAWLGLIELPKDGSTSFSCVHDDVGSMKIGGQETTFAAAGDTNFSSALNGLQSFEAYLMEYFGDAKLQLSWNIDGQSVPVPTEAFLRVESGKTYEYTVRDPGYTPSSRGKFAFIVLTRDFVLHSWC